MRPTGFQRLDQAGMTLIEVLIAITIFGIGMLAMANMQITSIRGNSSARGTTEASSLAQSKIEELSLLPYNAPELNDRTDDGVAGLNNATVATADQNQQVTIYGAAYNVFWNVANNSPNPNLKTIRVVVNWREAARVRTITMDALRSDRSL